MKTKLKTPPQFAETFEINSPLVTSSQHAHLALLSTSYHHRFEAPASLLPISVVETELCPGVRSQYGIDRSARFFPLAMAITSQSTGSVAPGFRRLLGDLATPQVKMWVVRELDGTYRINTNLEKGQVLELYPANLKLTYSDQCKHANLRAIFLSESIAKWVSPQGTDETTITQMGEKFKTYINALAHEINLRTKQFPVQYDDHAPEALSEDWYRLQPRNKHRVVALGFIFALILIFMGIRLIVNRVGDVNREMREGVAAEAKGSYLQASHYFELAVKNHCATGAPCAMTRQPLAAMYRIMGNSKKEREVL